MTKVKMICEFNFNKLEDSINEKLLHMKNVKDIKYQINLKGIHYAMIVYEE